MRKKKQLDKLAYQTAKILLVVAILQVIQELIELVTKLLTD